MSASEVVARFGTWALLRFVLALLVFVVLHLVRVPVVLVVTVLDAAMSRVDGVVTSAVSRDMTGSGAGEGLR